MASVSSLLEHALTMRFLNGSMTCSAGRQLAGGVSRCIVRYIPVIIRLGHLPHFPASGLAGKVTRSSSARRRCVCAKGFVALSRDCERISAKEAHSRTRLEERRARIQTVSYDYAVGGVECCKTHHRKSQGFHTGGRPPRNGITLGVGRSCGNASVKL